MSAENSVIESLNKTIYLESGVATFCYLEIWGRSLRDSRHCSRHKPNRSTAKLSCSAGEYDRDHWIAIEFCLHNFELIMEFYFCILCTQSKLIMNSICYLLRKKTLTLYFFISTESFSYNSMKSDHTLAPYS